MQETPTNPFGQIFSSMTSLKPERRQEGEEKGKKLIFEISIDSATGEPFLSTHGENPEKFALSTAESRLLAEINRLNSRADIWGISDDAGAGSRGVSVWKNPYLVNLMAPLSSICTPSGHPLTFSPETASLVLAITTQPDEKNASIVLTARWDDASAENPLFLDDTHVMVGDTVFSVSSVGDNYSKIRSLIEPVDKSLLAAYLTLFLTFVRNVTPELNGVVPHFSSHTEHSVATLFLEKVASDKALYLRTGSTLDSLDSLLPPGIEPTRVAYIGDDDRIVIRNVEGCDVSERTDRLEQLILSSAPNRQARKDVYRDNDFFIIPEETAGPFLLRNLPQVLEDFKLIGSEKLKEYKVVAAMPKLNLRLSSGIDYLEGAGDVEIGNQHFTISDILNQYAKKRYISLADGSRGIIDENYISRLQRLFRRADKNGKIRVTLFDLPDVEEMIQSKLTGKFAARSREVLQGFNDLKKAASPDYKVNATLRPYQIEGVKWLRYLYDNNLGGCLADDMGLGKTLQTIALLSMIYPGSEQPSLIVMPRSLLFNWEKELDRFAPQITHATYYGQDRDLEKALKSNVVLTTYALVRNDITRLRQQKFNCVILDESQNIKTYSAQTTMAVMLLDAAHRFALSGTPMENNLTELYSLFRFLNPTMFGTVDDFNTSYTYPIQKYGDKDASSSLRRKIFPFILRRLKKNVLKDLPDRIDQTLYVEMSEEQARLYNERRLSYRRQIEETIAREGIHKSQFMMLQAMLELRRIASVPESVSDYAVSSPKIEELIESLSSTVSNGHKSVVFFNFIAGIELVSERLRRLGIDFETMSGSTSAADRKRIVNRFQSDPSCMILLMTLKVGGVGLNLTAADTVYIFEPWWNKAAEEQAINRLHRIGQKSTVTALSLITVGTIEEKILQLQQQKSELFNELISSDTASSKQLTEQDIDFILS